MRVRAAILCTVVLGAAACGGHDKAGPPSQSAAPSREVTTAVVVRTGATDDVAVPATVEARKHAALAARIPASVTELPLREGQWAQAGTIVVRLDDAALRAAVAAAEAGLGAAEADLGRTKSLLDKGAATPRELEQVNAHAIGARAQLTGAREGLSYAVLRAPFAGRVAARRVDLGDVVNPGMPLIEIEGDGGLELRATVEASLAMTLKPGTSLRAVVDGQAGPIDATVTAIAPSGDPTTHRFELKADLPNSPGLRSGLFCRLLVPGGVATPRIAAPASSVFERGGLVGVFVVSEGKAHLRWVAAGAVEGRTVEIRAGLEAGERVALDPTGLTDGAAVRVVDEGREEGAAPRPVVK